jgi:hypothetical protein
LRKYVEIISSKGTYVSEPLGFNFESGKPIKCFGTHYGPFVTLQNNIVEIDVVDGFFIDQINIPGFERLKDGGCKIDIKLSSHYRRKFVRIYLS